MKQFFVILAVLALLPACSSKHSSFPNSTNEQILTELQWGRNYSAVNKILTEKFKLTYLGEEQQLPPMKVYLYSGGMYNNVPTKSWSVTFYNDSLMYIGLRVFEDSDRERERLFTALSELNDKECTKDTASTADERGSNVERRWYYGKEGKRMTSILFSLPKLPKSKEFAILLAKAY